MLSRANLSNYCTIALIIALIGSLTVTSASGLAPQKGSKSSVEKSIHIAIPILEIDEDETILDNITSTTGFQNSQPAYFISMPLPAAFDFQVYFFPPHLRVTFTHAP